MNNESAKAKFQVGDVVHHRRYDYRGVVVDYDRVCCADDSWYQKNVTQPSRKQPWYHVLVHGGAMTYVAQENLELDTSKQAINHPLIKQHFTSFHEGRYYPMSVN